MTSTLDSRRPNEYDEYAPMFHELADTSLPASRRHAVRQNLVTAHLPLADHIAWRFRNRGQQDDDLRQVARLGLIHAVDRFDPDRGSQFVGFAVPTIMGEVRRYFRDSTWSVRVPRRLKELNATLAARAETLGQQLGRAPRPSELAADLDLSIEEVCEGLQAGDVYRSESLDSGGDVELGSASNSDRLGALDPNLGLVEDRHVLELVLARLPEREATIVIMRFFGNMTQSQIAQRVGLSQMHVSRLLASSLKALREALADSV